MQGYSQRMRLYTDDCSVFLLSFLVNGIIKNAIQTFYHLKDKTNVNLQIFIFNVLYLKVVILMLSCVGKSYSLSNPGAYVEGGGAMGEQLWLSININKVVISVCLFDHHSETLGPICLKLWLVSSVEPREYSLLGFKVLSREGRLL